MTAEAVLHLECLFQTPIFLCKWGASMCSHKCVLPVLVPILQEAAAAAGTACAALQVQLEAVQQRLQLMEQQQSQVVEDARLACAATVPGECREHAYLQLQQQQLHRLHV